MVDVKCLSDYELDKHLKTLGFTPGPILPSTRKMYEKKLVQLLASPPCEPPVMNRLRRLHGSEDSSEDSEGMLQDQVRGSSVDVSPKKTTTKATRAPRAASHTRIPGTTSHAGVPGTASYARALRTASHGA
ncbi:LEM domain-containing protein 1 isoform X2 [Grammomys surdaster]|uniref:LEM domain-containing protein 1 isoform X2 n=1 Tax=Grammomys surdaster TaxID=491861 RepID=UPI0010A09E7A|nr:LEM domain-containing protein 1 isoform X2 [Grammomys surdaster]